MFIIKVTYRYVYKYCKYCKMQISDQISKAKHNRSIIWKVLILNHDEFVDNITCIERKTLYT